MYNRVFNIMSKACACVTDSSLQSQFFIINENFPHANYTIECHYLRILFEANYTIECHYLKKLFGQLHKYFVKITSMINNETY
jgi:hypothetical protein